MQDIETRSGVNGAGKPFVTMHWEKQACQFTPEEARQFARTVIEAAEAAEHDATFWAWMLDNLPGMPIAERAKLLASLRDYRDNLPIDEKDEQG